MGEKFSANPVTGTGSMTVPITTSPGRSGFGPQLSLTYDSGAGNGPFGFGWNLSIPTITRKTDKGIPQYRDTYESDLFILSGSEDLVPEFEKDGSGNWILQNGEYVIHEKPRIVAGVTFKVRRYRPRIEGLFARIERWTNEQSSEIHWRSISRDNVTTLYGKDNNSRIYDPSDPNPAQPKRIFSWLICESYDDKGNAIVYEYAAENDHTVDRSQANERNRVRTANRYLKRIKYGNRVSRLVEPDLTKASWLFEVIFDYEEDHYEEVDLDPTKPEVEQHRYGRASSSTGLPWALRPDPFSSYRSGFEIRTYRRCHRILMFHHIPDLPTGEKGYDGLVRSTEFDYDDLDYTQPVTIEDELSHQGSTRFASFIRRITQSGYVLDESKAVVVRNGVSYSTYLKKSLPPLEFKYSKAIINEEISELDAESLENIPYGIDGSSYQWIDLHGEGIPGIFTDQGDAWFYKPNLSPLPVQENESELVKARFAPAKLVPSRPNLAGGVSQAQFMDLAGDGQLDLVMLDGPAPGLFEHDEKDGWQPFRSFTSRLNRDTSDPNLRFVDLNGDGHTDVLITEDNAFTWHASFAEEGFGAANRVAKALDEENGARLVFADGTQSTYLADMCGDGLTDLVRIRNSEVCYWPNMGYGRFGPKVTMDNTPWFDHPEQFDQRHIRVADIDGSGTNDIIYFNSDGVRLYFNQSGNRLSDARRITEFPHVDNVSAAMALDLLGNGTACLVWSSSLPGDAQLPLRYIDLMGGTKPHLLIKSVNNLGAETKVNYATSTKFYLEDKLNDRPWVTRLPFPVQVVERVITHDHISGNQFVTRYAYHHGNFDPTEREFRGFGMVEQWDTEEFASLHANGQIPTGTNVNASSHVPPVLTRTWFHTGVYLGRKYVSNFYAGLLDFNDVGEYYREPGLSKAEAYALLLDDTVLPEGLTVNEEREACRALKGSVLRQEVYAQGGTVEAVHPYSVTEQNFTIRKVQPQGSNRHGVFFTHARESISYHYERKPNDPRIGHALTLEVDRFGNVLKSSAIGYGRRQPDPGLSPADQAKQAKILVTYTENRITDAVDTADDHRTPLPCESYTFELTGLTLVLTRHRFTLDDVLNAGISAITLEYENKPTVGRIEKRLIEHVRTYYRRNDFTGPLPLGELQSLAMPYESYKLALTPGLVAEVYGGRATESMLENEGRYVHTEGDASWWIPSGQILFSPNPGDAPAQELAHARQHFFLPHRYRNPFHTNSVSTESFVTYDEYDLLVEETRDALDKRVTVWVQDYRVLQPALSIDPNHNRSAVAFDALGMVVGTAVMGKRAPAQVEGDSLKGFCADLTQAEIDQFLTSPKGPMAATLLADATTRVVHDLNAYWREPYPARKPPAVSATLARETHVSDLHAGQQTEIQLILSYSDGFGREIQKKVQAESGPVPKRDANGKIIVGADGQPVMTPNDVSHRWVGGGWTVFNNKGKPIRQYEPFFTDTQHFEFDVKIGVSPVLFYDPVERVVATRHPNHTWEKVIVDPWCQETWDVNDTVLNSDPKNDADVGDFFRRLPGDEYLPTWHALRTNAAHTVAFAVHYPDAADHTNEARAAEKASIHAATPTVAHADSLGRTFLTVAHNKAKFSDTPTAAPPIEEFHSTRIIFDIEGNQREVNDAKGRVAMKYDYDMLGNRVHQASLEAGERWMLNDIASKPIYTWDSRDHRFRTAYDQLRRPIDSFLSEGGGAEIRINQTIYGETHPNYLSPETRNLRGKVVELRDQAGVVVSDDYDFKGNLLSSRRRIAQDYKSTLDWPWPGTVPLQSETYISRTRYDAINRPTQLIPPHSDQLGTKVNVIQLGYNDANLLEVVNAWLNQNTEPSNLLDPATASLHVVMDIDYDAKGQPVLIDYGNGVSITYTYDPRTFRLKHLLACRDASAFPDDCPQTPQARWPGCQIQNLFYTYDPSGNITQVRDDAQQTIYFRNRLIEPSSEYTYDAVYRLIEATGREHLGQGGVPFPHSLDDTLRSQLPHPGNGNAMGCYLEQYIYDEVGNFLHMTHAGTPAAGGWNRNYSYNEPSLLETGMDNNRLSSTRIGAGPTEYYAYDAHGNVTSIPHLPLMRWDFKDQLQSTSKQVVDNGGTPETTYYIYDSTGQRARKVTERQASAGGTPKRKTDSIYLSGFEVYREYENNGTTVKLERETLHIMDDRRRIALVETLTKGNEPGFPQQIIRYQLGNHLGSASLEVDNQSQIISYEEYSPYGSTSYQAVRSLLETPKRYRYTGKERDEENGFYYHGARYYTAWLCMWASCDPSGPLRPGPSPYCAFNNNPILFIDPDGMQAGYGIGTMIDRMSDKAAKGEITQKELDDYYALNAKIGVVGVLVNLAFLAPVIVKALGPGALSLLAKAGGGAVLAETTLDAVQTGGALIEATTNPSPAADLELAASLADLLSGLPTPAAELATARRMQRPVLVVGPERTSEFAAARKLQKAGVEVTTVNPLKTKSATEFESEGGRFIHKEVEKLPDNAKFGHVHENFPQPYVLTKQGLAKVKARFDRAPGKSVSITTENPDLLDMYKQEAHARGMTFKVKEVPATSVDLPRSLQKAVREGKLEKVFIFVAAPR